MEELLHCFTLVNCEMMSGTLWQMTTFHSIGQKKIPMLIIVSKLNIALSSGNIRVTGY